LLDTVFTSLDLADRLEWTRASQVRLRIEGGAGLEISSGEDNLVLRALRSLERASGRDLRLDIRLF